MNANRGGSHIDSPDWIKKKKKIKQITNAFNILLQSC